MEVSYFIADLPIALLVVTVVVMLTLSLYEQQRLQRQGGNALRTILASDAKRALEINEIIRRVKKSPDHVFLMKALVALIVLCEQ